MPYFPPCIGYGKHDDALWTAGNFPIGSTSVTLNRDGNFSVGDPLFASQSNQYAGIEYLGHVSAVSGDGRTLTFTVPVTLSKGFAALVWRPAYFVKFAVGAGTMWSKRLIPGVRTRASRGGVIYSTQTADSYWRLIFQWEKKEIDDFQAVLDFLAEYRNNGRDPFTLAFWDHFSKRSRVCIASLALGAADDDAVGSDLAGLLGQVERGGEVATYALQFFVSSFDALGPNYQYQMT